MKRPNGGRSGPSTRWQPPETAPASSIDPDEQHGSKDTPTEPIAIVAPVSQRSSETRAERTAPSVAWRGEPVPVTGDDPPSTVAPGSARSPRGGFRLPGAERRGVSRAARERRRFERGEVRRFTRRTRRRRLVALIVAGSLALLAIVVAVAAYSPLMAVRTIEIAGTSRLDAASLQSSLDDQLGVPLTLVDRAEVGEVLGDYPLIQSYSVQTRPPSTLVVTVVERTPVGVLASGGRFELVDSAGVVIETADAAQAGYPLLSTPTGGATGAAFRATTRVLLTLPAGLEEQVTAASASTGDDVALTLRNGAVVVWGGSDDSALKAVVLEKLMAASDPATVASYDVSSPQAAVVARR